MTRTYTQSDLNAALVAMVDRITEAIHKNYTGPTGGWLVSPKTMVDIIEKELLPADIAASVERERRKLQLEEAKWMNKYYAGVERPNHGAECDCAICGHFAALEAELKIISGKS